MLTTKDFDTLARFAKAQWGLNLPEHKRQLVSSRINKHVRNTHFDSIDDLIRAVKKDSFNEQELAALFDTLSTNVTSFFRDPTQFAYLEREFYTPLIRGMLTLPGKKVRIWSAACSTGCEPYTFAIQAAEMFKNERGWDVKILATDLDTGCVQTARQGVYPGEKSQEVEPELRARHFEAVPGEPGVVRVCESTRSLVSVHRLNLMADWPMRGPFNVIFCRNAMIYFDEPTREKLVNRFIRLLAPGGLFAVGTSETVMGDVPGLTRVSPGMYRKGAA